MKSNTGNGLIIFGDTGDLTKRKLIPAIYNLLFEKLLPDNFFLVAVGRRDKTTDEFVQEMEQAVREFSRNSIDKDIWKNLKNRIHYFRLDFDDSKRYNELNNYIVDLESKYKTLGNRLFYLAVSPEYFGVISNNLNHNNLTDGDTGYKRVVIEKPFGKDLASATALNQQLTNVFSEDNIYRVDHYLGKEMLQNIMIIRFANALFEPIWNNKYIDHVQISSLETLGVSERGGYYDKTGALKDMLQNHLLQFVSLVAMEPPKSDNTEAIRDEKVKVLKSIKKYNESGVSQNTVRGQYGKSKDGLITAYRDEERTDNDSNTETYALVKLELDNPRWEGVPFYIRTGKRLHRKCTQVIITFKSRYESLYIKPDANILPNQLIIRIQPTEGIYFRFNGKKPGLSNEIIPVSMDFCQNCQIGYNSAEAYVRLLFDAMNGDKTLFTRWDEVASSWEFIDSIKNAWESQVSEFPNYTAGSYGPTEADDLLKRDGREWVNE